MLLEERNRSGVVQQEAAVVAQPQSRRFNAKLRLAVGEIGAQALQLRGRHRMEAQLVEESQQPASSLRKLGRLPVSIPHLYRTADELIAARALHAVDTKVCAADA